MLRRHYNQRNSERGQSFMELALSLVFLLILLSVMIDLSWAFYTMISLRDVTQEAAAYGSMCAEDKWGIENRLRKSATTPLDANDISNFTLEYCTPYGVCRTHTPKTGDFIRLTATYQHHIVTPFIGMFIGNVQQYPLTVNTASAIMMLEGTHCDH